MQRLFSGVDGSDLGPTSAADTGKACPTAMNHVTISPMALSTDSTTGRLTDDGIERFREKVGVDWPYSRWTTWNEEATRDGIRHYAYGFGDDNPLYCDPEHAAGSRWGGIIAPPGFLEGAGLTPRLPDAPQLRGRGRGALSGVHMFWAGDHIRYFNNVHEGDRIWVRRFYVDITRQGAVEVRRSFGGVGPPARLLEPARRARRDLGRRLRSHRTRHRRAARHVEGCPRAARLHRRRAARRRRALRRRDHTRQRAPLRRGRPGRRRLSACASAVRWSWAT